MDPLSITASSVALAGTVAKVSIAIAQLIRDAREMRHDLDRVKRELDSIESILAMLADDFKRHSTESTAVMPESLVLRLSSVLTACEHVVLQIEALVTRYLRGGFRRRSEWLISGKADVDKLRTSLEAQKAALDIALDLIALYVCLWLQEAVPNYLGFLSLTVTSGLSPARSRLTPPRSILTPLRSLSVLLSSRAAIWRS